MTTSELRTDAGDAAAAGAGGRGGAAGGELGGRGGNDVAGGRGGSNSIAGAGGSGGSSTCPGDARPACNYGLSSLTECGNSVPRPGDPGMRDACRLGRGPNGQDVADQGPCVEPGAAGIFVSDCSVCANCP